MDANSHKTPPNSPSKKENMIGLSSVTSVEAENAPLKANLKDRTTSMAKPVAASIVVTPIIDIPENETKSKANKRKSWDAGNTLDHKNRIDKSPLTPKTRKRSSLLSLQSPEMLTPLVRSMRDEELLHMNDHGDHQNYAFSPEPLAKKSSKKLNNEHALVEDDDHYENAKEYSDLSKSVKSRVTYAYERYKMINSPISPTKESAYTKFGTAPSYLHSISGIGGITPHSTKNNIHSMNTIKNYSRSRRLSSSYQEMEYIDNTDNTNSAYEAFMKAIQSSPRFENTLDKTVQKNPQNSVPSNANNQWHVMENTLSNENKNQNNTVPKTLLKDKENAPHHESEPQKEAPKKLEKPVLESKKFESDAAESLVSLARNKNDGSDKI
ncbi:hypothetical protein ACO0QE_000088 [Hanseniaspora vineae]